jgi:hypothetical protein
MCGRAWLTRPPAAGQPVVRAMPVPPRQSLDASIRGFFRECLDEEMAARAAMAAQRAGDVDHATVWACSPLTPGDDR